MAVIAPGRSSKDGPTPDTCLDGSLSALLTGHAARVPDGLAFRDGPERERWSGRPGRELSWAAAARIVARFRSHLAGLGLDAGARVGICLPNGSEACLAILATEAAGLTPCLLDITAGAGDLSGAIEASDIRALITQGVLGDDRPADKLCFVAAGFFRLRFLLAFGPGVPDGVVDLDPILNDDQPSARLPLPSAGAAGVITFGREPRSRLAHRSCRSLVAAAASFLVATKLKPGDRIVTFLPPDDLKSLATGLSAALVAGAALEAHGVFESAALARTLGRFGPTHLVVPGWMEANLREARYGPSLQSTVLVHEPPIGFDGRPGLDGRVVDAVSFGELALMAAVRDSPNRIGLSLPSSAASAFVEARLCEGEQIWFRGPSVLHRATTQKEEEEERWIPSGFRADLIAGTVVGVS